MCIHIYMYIYRMVLPWMYPGAQAQVWLIWAKLSTGDVGFWRVWPLENFDAFWIKGIWVPG